MQFTTQHTRPSSANPLIKRILEVRQVSRVTSGGKVRSSRVLVVMGNQNGFAGYGIGRGPDVASATLKATQKAAQNMEYFDRLDNRTIFHDTDMKFQRTKLAMRVSHPGKHIGFFFNQLGYGIVCNNISHEIFRCVGISDIYCKIRGSTNVPNVVQATFQALRSQKSPADIARLRGKKVVDMEETYYGKAFTKI